MTAAISGRSGGGAGGAGALAAEVGAVLIPDTCVCEGEQYSNQYINIDMYKHLRLAYIFYMHLIIFGMTVLVLSG